MKITHFPTQPAPDLLEQMIADAETNNDDFHLTDLDYGCLLLGSLDYKAQILAINNLLRLNARNHALASQEIEALEEKARRASGLANQRMIDQWIDLLHGSVFRDAAHSMAAVGMLAPLIETIFHRGFLAIGEKSAAPPTGRLHMTSDVAWDCHYVGTQKGRRKDLIGGIFQLADAVGLTPQLPSNTRPIMKALIAYRNKIFHHGFEWPVDQRTDFGDRIRSENWPVSWFRSSTVDNEPWIYYLSEAFIAECISLMEEVLEALGRFSKNLSR